MARSTVTVDIKSKLATYQHKSLKELPAIALDLADMPTHSGLQTEIALIGYAIGQKSGKADYDFNRNVFVPYCMRYYGEGRGLQRKPLKGFSEKGEHAEKSSALTLLRGYEHFYKAGKSGINCEPVIRSIMEAGGELAKKGIATKGAMLSKLLEEAKGKAPKADAITAAIDKVNNAPEGTGPDPVKTAAKAFRSRVAALAADAKFAAKITPAEKAQFEELVQSAIAFKMTVLGEKVQTSEDTALLALVASLAQPVEKTTRRRARG
jgi:hypothetical protein